MTYLQFLGLFVAAPTVLLGIRLLLRKPPPVVYLYILGLAVVAVIYATPWDNYLVWKSVWTYGADRVIGTIGYVPIEEYMFFVLQVLFTSTWTLAVHPVFVRPAASTGMSRSDATPADWAEAIVYVALLAAGVIAFFVSGGLYFALIAVWAAPVCLFQWWFSPRYLATNRKLLLAAIAPPTLYLALADRYAIAEGIWSITDATRSGLYVVGLPVEEALFFLMTNVMVVQGLVLLLQRNERTAS